jgi:hypothetical protein
MILARLSTDVNNVDEPLETVTNSWVRIPEG